MDVVVERLTPARAADYLRFFDHERGPAFADNPAWATCYCHYHHVAPALDWSAFTGEMNRIALAARIETGEMEGYLAYRHGEVVGWMNAQPYPKLRHACERMEVERPPLPVPAHDAAAIVCFVVAAPERRQGVARTLLAQGLANLALRGVALVDAFPQTVDAADAAAGDAFRGHRALFANAGFTPIATSGGITVMRKILRP